MFMVKLRDNNLFLGLGSNEWTFSELGGIVFRNRRAAENAISTAIEQVPEYKDRLEVYFLARSLV